MTGEEQLDWLYRLRSEIYVYMPKEWLIPMNNALDMTIKALEQEHILDKIRAEIDEQYDKVHPYNLSCAEGLEMALGIIDKYNAESEEKEEISKDDAIKIVHDTIHDFFVDSETFNDKDKLLLKINKAICNNIMGY